MRINQPPIPKSPDPFFERIAKLSLLGLLVYWSFVIVRPFLTLVLWSLILTVALYPVLIGPPGVSAAAASWRQSS
jgi:hypothetical protein